jgi:hypothetical protein
VSPTEKSDDKRDIQGTIIRRDPDGYGLVELTGPERDVIAFFTNEVLQNPKIARSCIKGAEVKGRAVIRNGGYRIIRLEPR